MDFGRVSLKYHIPWKFKLPGHKMPISSAAPNKFVLGAARRNPEEAAALNKPSLGAEVRPWKHRCLSGISPGVGNSLWGDKKGGRKKVAH